jgi:hypothetical protein
MSRGEAACAAGWLQPGALSASLVHHLSRLVLVVEDGLAAATGGDALGEHGDHNVHAVRLTSLQQRTVCAAIGNDKA